MRKKRKQTSKEKNLEERIENLRQQGFYFPPNIQSPKKTTPEKQTRLIRRIADWWETTSIEKFIEDIDYFLANFAILNVISLLANITLILSLVTWLMGLEEQKENKRFATWTIINDGKGDRSGVVRTAVERLYKEGFSLSGLELQETSLIQADLSGASLIAADLSKADLREADLSGASLGGANLSGAYLGRANLSQSSLFGANLSGTDLYEADLHGAYLFNAKNLSNAQIKLACNWKEAIYVEYTVVDNKWFSKDEQANQEKIKKIEQDKDSDPKNPPDCSKWE